MTPNLSYKLLKEIHHREKMRKERELNYWVNLSDNIPNPVVPNYTEEYLEYLLIESCALYLLKDEVPKNHTIIERFFNNTPDRLYSSISMSKDDKFRTKCFYLADSIRKYYLGRNVYRNLMGMRNSTFKESLFSFLNFTTKEKNDKLLTLVYKLPHLYEYDTHVDSNLPSVIVRKGVGFNNLTPDTTLELEFLFKSYRKIKKFDGFIYFFKDSNDDIVVVELLKSNGLLDLLDQYLLNNANRVKIKGWWRNINLERREMIYCDKFLNVVL